MLRTIGFTAMTIGLALGVVQLTGCGGDEKEEAAAKEPLLCYAEGCFQPALEELVESYEEETGRTVKTDYSGCGELLAKMEQTREGDLFVSHTPYLGALTNKGFCDKGRTIAIMEPMILVPEGNPENIQGLADLANPGLKVVLPDRKHSTTGYIVARMLKRAGVKKEVHKNVVNRTAEGSGAANAVQMGTVDAAICWNVLGHARQDKVDMIDIQKQNRMKQDMDAVSSATFGKIEMDYVRATVASLNFSKQKEKARDFARYIASEENLSVWKKHGFLPPADDRPHPELKKSQLLARTAAASSTEEAKELLVHCAAGVRKPVKEVVQEFEQNNNVDIQLNYNGTGRLFANIKMSGKGDVYIAGDADYIDMAEEEGLVETRRPVCYFVPVILVQKGNPKNISSLSDLVQSDLKIGQGDPEAAAVGRLTPKILKKNDIDMEKWQKNVQTQTPTVNELGVHIEMDRLDAALVWDAMAYRFREHGTSVQIPPEKNICPTVGSAVLTTSENPEVARSLLTSLTSTSGKKVFKSNGYTVKDPTVNQ